MTMTAERTQAYGRVMKTLQDMGPAKLQPSEQERIRDAADTLIFAGEIDEARAALRDLAQLADHLVSTGRWTAERTDELVEDLLACGPVDEPAYDVAA
jgi:polyhydroxyalkanoate synthesis regulator phasin